MKLQLKCDRCGKVGTPEEISTDYDDCDLCDGCLIAEKLEQLEKLKSEHEKTQTKLMEDLAMIAADIAALKQQLK